MSTEEELRAQLEELKKENESLKARTSKGISIQGQREGRRVGLRNGTLAQGNALQGAVDQVARHG